jgi:hypothetical protein
MTSDAQEARSIAQVLLERAGAALMSQDFPAFTDCFEFPYDLETINGLKRLEMPEDLRIVFFNVHTQFRRIGVTQMERYVVEASFRASTTILCTHETRLFHDWYMVQKPYPVFSILSLGDDDVWRFNYGTYGLEATAEHKNALTANLLDRTTPLDPM